MADQTPPELKDKEQPVELAAEQEPEPQPAPGEVRFRVDKPCHFGGKQHKPARKGDRPVILFSRPKDPVILALVHFKQVVQVDAELKPVVAVTKKRATAPKR